MLNNQGASETIDSYSDTLHRAGWSSGDLSFNNGERLVWQVYAYRGDQRIVARASTQSEAWWLAAKQARDVGCV